MQGGLLVVHGLGVRPTLVLCELLLVAPGLLVLAVAGLPLVAALRLRRLDSRAALLAALGGVFFWVASLGLLELQSALWPPPPGYLELFRRLHEALRPAGPLDFLFSLSAIALAPAICEEVLNRGIVLPSLRSPLGDPGAVMASAALFALMHLDANLDAYRLPFTFAIGLALGALRLRTGSLLPGVIIHSAFNSLTFVAAPFLDDPAQSVPTPRPLLGAAMLLVGSALSVALITRFPLTPGDRSA
jgi:membrane protease YdiL (CAAX protease family)